MADLQDQMKQAVAAAATEQIQSGMVVGLGSGSTAALMIQALGAKLKSGELRDIVGVTTSFQGEVLAAELGIPLQSLNAVDRIDLAIDGADEVDPSFQLIKGGGACHVQEKLVAVRAKRFVVVVDSTKLVDTLNLGFLLPVEVMPGAWRQVQGQLKEMGVTPSSVWQSKGWSRRDGPGQPRAGRQVQRWHRRSRQPGEGDQQPPRRSGERSVREHHRPGAGGRDQRRRCRRPGSGQALSA